MINKLVVNTLNRQAQTGANEAGIYSNGGFPKKINSETTSKKTLSLGKLLCTVSV